MNKQLKMGLLVGGAAVVGYLLYMKFVAKPPVKETVIKTTAPPPPLGAPQTEIITMNNAV